MNNQKGGAERTSPSKEKKSARKEPRKRRLLLFTLLLLGTAIGAYFGYGWLMFRLDYVSSDDARIKGNLVAISPKIQGKISHIHVEEGDAIQQGLVVAELESREYSAELKKVQSVLEKTRKEIIREKTQLDLVTIQVKKKISETKLSISQAEDSLKMAQQEYALQKDVVQKEINKARANFMMARAQVTEERARLQGANWDFERTQKLFNIGLNPDIFGIIYKNNGLAGLYHLAGIAYFLGQNPLDRAFYNGLLKVDLCQVHLFLNLLSSGFKDHDLLFLMLYSFSFLYC